METEDDETEQNFRELCLAVNMDKPTMELAWKAYEMAKRNYTLEGDSLHWLVCALYSACRRNLPLMKSVSGHMLSSNCVSLTNLLHEANFSFISFLKKMEKWLRMNNNQTGGPLCDHVAALDRSFRVATVVFKKYRLVFKYVFLDPDNPVNQSVVKGSSKNPSRPHRSRRHLKRQCNPKEIFNFCWTLFIHAKGTKCHTVSDELVSSFQLLLSAVDLCFQNALACEHRSSLLNPDFPGLPKGWNEDGDATFSGDGDIIALLVKQPAALQLSKDETEEFLLQARVKNIHNWKEYISSLLQSTNNVLVGSERSLLLPENFATNSKAINKVYEEYVITEGDFDERVFLCDDVDRELGTPIKGSPQNHHKRELEEHLASETIVAPKTPLTNRQYLEGKRDEVPATPVSIAYQAIAKLKKILHGKDAAPSDKLLAICRECKENPEEEIKSRVAKLGTIFKREHMKQYGDIPPSPPEFTENRLTMSKTLYYHVLEGTLLQEKKRLKNNAADLTDLLKRNDFHKLLFACCVEIVLCSLDSPRTFPWVLDAFGLSPYYFYKVIELVVRAEENLSGQCVKHLNHIEENILESLAWKNESPLWDALDEVQAPMCEEVNYPQNIERGSDKTDVIKKSPITHPRLKALLDNDFGSKKSDTGSAQDRFSSPVAGSAKRRLFTEKGEAIAEAASITEESNNGQISSSDDQIKDKPKRVGSLALFFRKFYHLASVRLRHLCDMLGIPPELRTKIWTCFEHSVSVWSRDLMQDRHVDQLLMCSVYIMAKITQHDHSFQEIMRCYRSQPQAISSVYRSVLIKRSQSPVTVPSKPTLRSRGAPPPPSPPPQRIPEERDDLIQFYNRIYVPKIRPFVKKFNPSSDANQVLEVPLSPMPRQRITPQSPRRVTGNVYVSPLKSHVKLQRTSPSKQYIFQRSPAKSLRVLNAMQRHAPVINMKRQLAFTGPEQEEVVAKRPAISRRLELVHAERNGAQ